MITMHLSDDQIQDFLDQNLSQEDRLLVNEHLRNCQQCQNELSRYQRLYMALNQETVIELSPAWSAAVMKRIRAEVRKIVLRRFLNLLLPIGGIIAGIAVMLYYVEFGPIVAVFLRSLNPARYFDNKILLEIDQSLAKFNINFSLIAVAGLSLLVVLLLDQIISKHKGKFTSFLKGLPVF
ncbi:MAG: hypothetical protein ONB27_09960 [candidate division KSB1 bacterium]|nr:hypothetical protein [candidate division KSB1 bacterium]